MDGSATAPASVISRSPTPHATTTSSPIGHLTVWQQPHFHLSKRYCLCEKLYEIQRDRVVAITSFEGSLSHGEVAESHIGFPPQGNVIDAYSLAPFRYKNRASSKPVPRACVKRDCSPANPRSIRRREIATLHLSCFNRLTCLDGTNNVFDRFSWLMQCRASPFDRAPRLHLRAMSPYPLKPRRGSRTAVGLVRTHRFESPFWKLARAMEVNWRLVAMLQGSHDDVEMTVVKDWRRGDSYNQLKKRHQHLRTIRFTLDAYGIHKIERLPRKPVPFSGEKTDDKAYIVVDEWEVQGVILCLKWDLGRLTLPAHHPGLQIWDTPTPPHIEYYGPDHGGVPVDGANVVGMLVNVPNRDPFYLDECVWSFQGCELAGSASGPMSRFYTIDLKSVTGLTFLYGPENGLIGIHGHTLLKPDVEVPPDAPNDMHWIYVPVTEDDEIMKLGAHVVPMGETGIHTPAFEITTKLAGEIYVGPWQLQITPLNVFSRDAEQLIYNRIDNNRGLGFVDLIGVYPRDDERILNNNSSNPLEARRRLTDFRPQHLSWAPLTADITRVRVYRHDNGERSFQGMLINYGSGGQRSLGTYRADSILAEEYHNPTGVCIYGFDDGDFAADPSSKARLIFFYDEMTLPQNKDGWYCYNMSGQLQLVFQGEYTRAQVVYPMPPRYLIPIIEGDEVRYEYAS